MTTSASNPGERRQRRWWLLAAVTLPLVVYLTVVASGYDGRPYLRGDCPYYYLTAVSLLRDGDLDLANQLPGELSRYSGEVALDRDGRLVPKHPIAMPFASAPLIGLFGPPGAITFNLLQLVLLAALVYALTRRLAAPWAAATATAATGAATLLPHYAWNYSPDIFSTLLLVAAMVALPPPGAGAPARRLAVAGLLAGLAVASKLPLVVAVPWLLLLLPGKRPRAWLAFGLGLALPLLLLASFDLYLFGAPWVTSYDRIARWTGSGWTAVSQRRDFGEPLGTGLFRLLMDRRHGLVPTSLLTVVSLAGLPWLWRRWKAGAVVVGGVAAALLLLFAGYRLWDQSHYGNRFLMPVVALAALPLATALEPIGRRLARLRSLRVSRTDLAFALIVVLQLVPIWNVEYLPTQDGPAHLENASLLLDLNRRDRPYLREVYELDPRPEPTWANQLALASLLGTFPPLVAEKLFLSAYLMLFPLAFRSALRALRPGAQDLAFLALPLSAGYLFHLGFQSFCWSLALLAVALAYWLRRDGALDTARERLAFAGLGLLVWLGHPVTLVALAAAVAAGGALLAYSAPGGAGPGDPAGRAARLRRHGLVPLLALAPSLALVAAFALSQAGGDPRWMPLGARLRALVTLDPLTSFDPRELWLSAAMGVLLAAAAVAAAWRRPHDRRPSRADAAAAGAAAVLLLFLVAPDGAAGGGWISHRLLLLFLLLAVLWLGSQPLGRRVRLACQLGGAGIALGLAALHAGTYAEISPYLREYTALAVRSPAGATLLPMTSSPWGSTPDGRRLSAKVRPFLHTAGYAAAESESAIVLLNNYQAALTYFPVRYRSGDAGAGPAELILLWGTGEDPALRGYRQVAVSDPTGLGRLYTADPLSAAAAGR